MPQAEDSGQYVSDQALREVAEALRQRRDGILQNWIQRVGHEPFHLGRVERAVADHIPKLLDAVIDNLVASTQGREPLGFREQDLRAAAAEHARARLLQGLSVSEVITELRILVQEISAELRTELREEKVQLSDILGAELVVHDVVFGAAVVAAEILADSIRQERSDAAGLVVHDLRTPLTSVRGFAQLLSRTPESERVAQAAAMILSQTARLMGLIDEFLIATQATGEIASIDSALMDMTELVSEVVASLGDEARRRVSLAVEPAATTAGEWDKAQLLRVLENILANSLKYAPTGDVWVTIGNSDGDHVYVRVRDEGIGIAPEDRAKVLEPYYRSTDAIRRSVEGTGLGLFIAHGIVEAHSGTLSVESPGTGQGTTVTIALPKHLSTEA